MASARPEGDANLRKKWLRYKETMRRNAPKAVDLILRFQVDELRRRLLADSLMEFEFLFIDVNNTDVPERDIVARLWNTLIFRPDAARRVEELCRGEHILQKRFADLLREAIEAAGWSEDLWSSPSQTDISLTDLRRVGDALAGLATICCSDLERHGILTIEAAAAVSKKENFSESRGRELAHQLTSQGWSKLQQFCETEAKNRFVLRVFDAAIQGHWPGPPAIAANLPDLPTYVTERDCFGESREKLQQAVECDKQMWVDIWGPRAAGKTTAALHLANRVPNGKTALWFSFGEKRSEEAIYDSARRVVENCFPKSDLSENPDAKIFLRETLTPEATKDFILFLDDVCDVNVLAPFARVKNAVITSPCLVPYHAVESTLDVSVDLSLTEKESIDIVENIVKVKLSSIDGHEFLIDILRSTKFNALATSMLASHIKSMDRKKWNRGFFEKLKKNAKYKFQNINRRLKNRGHEYLSEKSI